MIEAPWTAEQVAALNAWQHCGWVHPFTCREAHPEGRNLLATESGWICPHCDYRQSWAHDFMFEGAPPDPRSLLPAPTNNTPPHARRARRGAGR